MTAQSTACVLNLLLRLQLYCLVGKGRLSRDGGLRLARQAGLKGRPHSCVPFVVARTCSGLSCGRMYCEQIKAMSETKASLSQG